MSVMSLTSATLNANATVAFYGSTSGNVYAIVTANGILKWLYQTGDAVYSAPGYTSLGGGYVAFGCQDNNVYLLTDRGKLVWKQKTEFAVSATPVFSADGSTIYVGSQDGTVYAYSVSTTVYSRIFVDYTGGNNLDIPGATGPFTVTNAGAYCTANPRCMQFIFDSGGCWFKDSIVSANPTIPTMTSYYKNQTVWMYSTSGAIVSAVALGRVVRAGVSVKAVFVASMDFSVYALEAGTVL